MREVKVLVIKFQCERCWTEYATADEATKCQRRCEGEWDRVEEFAERLRRVEEEVAELRADLDYSSQPASPE